MTSRLERLADTGGSLVREPPDAGEFAGLLRSGLARRKDAENEANSLDSRFDLAYSAAHALCLAPIPRIPTFESIHRLPGATRHSRPGPGSMESSFHVPRRAQPDRVRRYPRRR